ncbi:hypothetical protein QTN25_004288 [Entamoeba marina]
MEKSWWERLLLFFNEISLNPDRYNTNDLPTYFTCSVDVENALQMYFQSTNDYFHHYILTTLTTTTKTNPSIILPYFNQLNQLFFQFTQTTQPPLVFNHIIQLYGTLLLQYWIVNECKINDIVLLNNYYGNYVQHIHYSLAEELDTQIIKSLLTKQAHKRLRYHVICPLLQYYLEQLTKTSTPIHLDLINILFQLLKNQYTESNEEISQTIIPVSLDSLLYLPILPSLIEMVSVKETQLSSLQLLYTYVNIRRLNYENRQSFINSFLSSSLLLFHSVPSMPSDSIYHFIRLLDIFLTQYTIPSESTSYLKQFLVLSNDVIPYSSSSCIRYILHVWYRLIINSSYRKTLFGNSWKQEFIPLSITVLSWIILQEDLDDAEEILQYFGYIERQCISQTSNFIISMIQQNEQIHNWRAVAWGIRLITEILKDTTLFQSDNKVELTNAISLASIVLPFTTAYSNTMWSKDGQIALLQFLQTFRHAFLSRFQIEVMVSGFPSLKSYNEWIDLYLMTITNSFNVWSTDLDVLNSSLCLLESLTSTQHFLDVIITHNFSNTILKQHSFLLKQLKCNKTQSKEFFNNLYGAISPLIIRDGDASNLLVLNSEFHTFLNTFPTTFSTTEQLYNTMIGLRRLMTTTKRVKQDFYLTFIGFVINKIVPIIQQIITNKPTIENMLCLTHFVEQLEQIPFLPIHLQQPIQLAVFGCKMVNVCHKISNTMNPPSAALCSRLLKIVSNIIDAGYITISLERLYNDTTLTEMLYNAIEVCCIVLQIHTKQSQSDVVYHFIDQFDHIITNKYFPQRILMSSTLISLLEALFQTSQKKHIAISNCFMYSYLQTIQSIHQTNTLYERYLSSLCSIMKRCFVLLFRGYETFLLTKTLYSIQTFYPSVIQLVEPILLADYIPKDHHSSAIDHFIMLQTSSDGKITLSLYETRLKKLVSSI